MLGLVKRASVNLKQHKIIYNLLDDLKEAMADLLPPEEHIEVVGEAEILQLFEIKTKGKDHENAAGCRILTGKVLRNTPIK